MDGRLKLLVLVGATLAARLVAAEGFGFWADELKRYEAAAPAVTLTEEAEPPTAGRKVARLSLALPNGRVWSCRLEIPTEKPPKRGWPLAVLVADGKSAPRADVPARWATLSLPVTTVEELTVASRAIRWTKERFAIDERRVVCVCEGSRSAFGLALSALTRDFSRTGVLLPAACGGLERRRMLDLEAMVFAQRLRKPIRFVVGCPSGTTTPPNAVRALYDAVPAQDKAIRHEPGMTEEPSASARAALEKWLFGDKLEPLDASHPDYVVFRPHQFPLAEYANPALRGDTYNDHFHVIWDGKRHRHYAFWTQGTMENAADMHVAFATSDDGGRTWTEPRILAGGECAASPRPRAVWQQPMLAKSGRLYCLVNRQTTDHPLHHGEMFGTFSDDGGETWSPFERVPMRRMLRDDPDPSVPPQWCNWQRPLRLGKDGRFLVGCTRHGRKGKERPSTRVEFWEFENIDEDPAVRDIRIGYHAADAAALTVRTGDTGVDWCEEAGIVRLPDGRLFALMRTRFRHPYWSQSRDEGRTWSRPQPLKDADGEPFLHPCSPCPIYDWKGCEAASGTYFALIHNAYDESLPLLKKQKRGPLYLIAGAFDPDGEQPIRFSKPRLFSHVRHGNACYSSYTVANGEGVLWFAHQKHTLVGRRIAPEWVAPDPAPAAHAKILPETQLFFQAQLYPWREQARGYLGRYLNQPLLVDPDLPEDEDLDGIDPLYGWGMFPSQADYDRTMEYAAQYGVDGLALFARRPQRYFRAADRCPTKTMKVVPIVMFQKPEESKEEVRSRYAIEENKRGYFHDGRQLVLSYWVEHGHTPESFRGRCDTIRRRLGGRWRFVASLPSLVDFRADYVRNGGRLTPETANAIRARVSAWARAADGIQVCEAHMNHEVEHGERVFAAAYWRDLNRLVAETLRTGEFAGRKLFCTAAVNGHLNSYQTGYNTLENGTKTLRDSLETALALDPDVVLMPEWDEHNENTSFAPTLYGGWSVRRIVRHYADRMKRRPLSPIAGDDLALPNLVVSYRKSVSPGERLIIEVLNVPDGSRAGEVSVAVSVTDENGKELRRLSARTLDEAEISDVRHELDTAALAERARALRIRLDWRKGGARGTVCEGLHPIDLAPASSWNRLCVKTALRDLARPTVADVALREGRVHARFVGDEPIRYAMLCGNGEIQYIQGRKDAAPDRFREDEAHAAFAISLVGPGRYEARKGAPFTWKVPGLAEAEWLYYTGVTRGDTFATDDVNGVSTPPVYLRLPKSRLKDARLEVDLPGIYRGSIPLDEAFARQAYSVGDSVMKTMVTATRFALQSRYPSVANEREVGFDVVPCIDRRSMMYHVQLVTMSGRTWCSRPFVVEAESSSAKARVWSSRVDAAVDLTLPSSRLPILRYDFAPVAGNVLPVESGERHWFGMAGGPVTPVTLWNRGARTEGGLCGGTARAFEEKAEVTVPRRVREADGSWSLAFDGVDDYANFPSEAWPAVGGATVEFDLWRDPAQTNGAALFRYRRDVGMGLGLRLTDGGRLCAFFCGMGVDDVETEPAFVSPGVWHRVRLTSRCDTLELSLDGRLVSSIPIRSPSRYLVPSMLGGYPGEGFFRGRIRNFSITHVDEPKGGGR